MAYYDSIAKLWHATTGYKGGAFKEQVLNDILLRKFPRIDNCYILELGAGNGYFLPLLLRRFSGQVPSEVIVTDQSRKLVEIARKRFWIPEATYQTLDVGKPFPFANDKFDIVFASMVFNEVPSRAFRNGLKECYRVLLHNGLFVMAVIHPDFINSLQKRQLLKSTKEGILTMPGAGTLRLPVVVRSLENYRSSLQESGFHFEEEEIFRTQEVLNLKAGLRNARSVPVALVYTCRKSI